MSITVGKLGKRYGISRTSLLYYDTIGLLKPSGRTGSGYRLYTEEDAKRLEFLLALRGAGIPLGEIESLLPAGKADLSIALMRRLGGLNWEIKKLQEQQRVVIRLLKSVNVPRENSVSGREYWAARLRDAGLEEDAMLLWHADFESYSPQRHGEFLKTLDFTDAEVSALRERLEEIRRRQAHGSEE